MWLHFTTETISQSPNQPLSTPLICLLSLSAISHYFSPSSCSLFSFSPSFLSILYIIFNFFPKGFFFRKKLYSKSVNAEQALQRTHPALFFLQLTPSSCNISATLAYIPCILSGLGGFSFSSSDPGIGRRGTIKG
jgi:hypothetical protein